MTPFEIFALTWIVGVMFSFMAHGIWGEWLYRHDYVSPIPVAILWPVALVGLVVAAPFIAAFSLGHAFRKE